MGSFAKPTAQAGEEVTEVQLVFNELSLSTATSRHSACTRMLELRETASAAVERGIEGVLLVPIAFMSADLSKEYTFSHWLDDPDVELEVRQAVRSWISWGPFLDDVHNTECAERSETVHAGVVGLGLSVATVRDHAVISFSVDPWKRDALSVTIRTKTNDGSPGEERSADIHNFYCPDSVERRLVWVATKCCVKPQYENPGHHDPKSGVFRGGGGMTSILPTDAHEVYLTSVPTDAKDASSSWWGQSATGYLYRYQVSWQGGKPVAHWNGSTDPKNARVIADREIPTHIRERFPDRA